MRNWTILAMAAFLLLGGTLMAQNRPTPTRVGYIDAEKVVQAHKDFKKVQDIRNQAERELKPIRDQIQALEAKIRAGNATAKEQQDYRIAAQSLQEAGKKWTERANTALKPITEEIDRVIARIAQQQGFAIILDKKVAATSGLVVYAAEELEITDAVIKALPK
ncbi:MAG: OmpH family outer membrane protein [Meiothermus sp.]|uniref:OmpH family outer membrane protein n=1 Tax=Meiothermus sp. TaxID=1955249 RepID=UPI0025DBC2A6|nr:OmpH family outer membrane protein [Meiothermus sp.]MCS7057455.1 OmpH family outer membrane protein [Meiothermus sp.]MCS7194149.1 OmpH family outer membrane protein [Meiothermus sp.]MCX7740004.1 OmpH family outer membrane protein [Meiothermus sp.]MDW8091590.1 OmpH family outer membrane protein [Meiothermus sp.]MDW8481540.1 OmpH family outer membrane protein [Meiothermus sp.]